MLPTFVSVFFLRFRPTTGGPCGPKKTGGLVTNMSSSMGKKRMIIHWNWLDIPSMIGLVSGKFYRKLSIFPLNLGLSG